MATDASLKRCQKALAATKPGSIDFQIRRFKLLHNNMEPEDAKYLRTDRRPGKIDVHPTMNALILNYELEVQILGGKETSLYGEKAPMQKIIELPILNSRIDCNALAKEVILQCDLIHPSRLIELEQTIYYLKKRKMTQNVSSKENDATGKNSPTDEVANINSLSEYIELLYEGVSDKIKASNLILQLARDPDNLESLSKNETALSALARVLREDWKRSIVLSTNLVFTFFCFSTYTCFHHVILEYKIGSLCMDIVDFELRRYDEWRADLEGITISPEPPIIRKTCPSSASMSDIPRSRIPEPIRPKSGNFSDTNLNFKGVMDGSTYDDLTNSTELIDDKKDMSEADKAKRYRTMIKKQEQLLRVAFYLLLNISEDSNIEEKMTKKNIIGLLVKALDRRNEELLVLVVTFLKKLSVIESNKDEMAELNIIEKLPQLLQTNNPDLVYLTLKLLLNLSFDDELRLKMLKLGLLPKFVSLLTDDRHQDIVIKLLYHMSYDNEAHTYFIYTDCASLITDMLLLNATREVDQVMVALCINLALNASNAQQMADSSRLHSLMTRAFAYQDGLLMKLIRNISEHESTKTSFIEFVGDLAKAVTESKNEDFILECLGVLSNLHLPDLDWAEIFKHFKLISWIENQINLNTAEPDLILQVIVLLGTASYDEGCSALLCESTLLPSLIGLLKTHQEDDEIVLQILYVFYVVLSHDSCTEYVINKTEAPAYLIDLLQDNNKFIRKICNNCLNKIADHSTTWADRIRIEKFRNHNAQWLQMVDSDQLPKAEDEEDDFELPPYLNTEYLSSVVIPPLSESELRDSDLIPDENLELDFFDKPSSLEMHQVEAA